MGFLSGPKIPDAPAAPAPTIPEPTKPTLEDLRLLREREAARISRESLRVDRPVSVTGLTIPGGRG